MKPDDSLTLLAHVTASSAQIRLLCPEITTDKPQGMFNPPPICFHAPHLTHAVGVAVYVYPPSTSPRTSFKEAVTDLI